MIKKRKEKKHGVSYWKIKAWDEFSIFIRRRDCLKTSGDPTHGFCFTCGAHCPFKTFQAGHFIPGRHPSYLFDEVGCHIQCFRCNINLKGNWPKYYEAMLKEYGQEVVDSYQKKKWESKQFKAVELEEIYNKYKALNGKQ